MSQGIGLLILLRLVPFLLFRISMITHLQVGLEIGQCQVELLEQKAGKTQLIAAFCGIRTAHPRQRRHEGGFRLFVFIQVEMTLTLQISSHDLPLVARLQIGNLCQGLGCFLVLFQLIISQASLVKSAGRLIGRWLGTGKFTRPFDHAFPFRLGKRDIANRSQSRNLERLVLKGFLLVNEKLPGIVLSACVEHAPALKHDNALPIDLLVQS